jgi:hypothetical protein
VYKGDEQTISATFNYSVGNYSFEECNFSEKLKRRQTNTITVCLSTPFGGKP